MSNEITKVIGEIELNNETLVITDPCYLLHKGNGDEIKEINGKVFNDPWVACGYGYKFNVFGVEKFVTSTTLYGDWSCTVFDQKNTKKTYGEFCADAGLVTIIPLYEVLKFNPTWLDWHKDHEWCSSLIPDFNGKVRIVNGYKEYPNNEEERYEECWIEGYGNINFISGQTGFQT